MPLIRVPAYGWKWATQLAQLGEDVVGSLHELENANVEAADNNADSVALFCSGTWLYGPSNW